MVRRHEMFYGAFAGREPYCPGTDQKKSSDGEELGEGGQRTGTATVQAECQASQLALPPARRHLPAVVPNCLRRLLRILLPLCGPRRRRQLHNKTRHDEAPVVGLPLKSHKDK